MLHPARNIKVGLPVIRNRREIGQVVRHLIYTYVHNLEGRRIGDGRDGDSR